MGVNINTVKENIHVVLDASEDWSGSDHRENLSISSYLITRMQVNIKIANKSFENAAKFRCLGMIVTNQSDVHEGN